LFKKIKIALLLPFLFIHPTNISAQQPKQFADKHFLFELKVDSTKEYYGYYYFVTAITVTRLSDKKIVQRLMPGPEDDWKYYSYKGFLIEDMNFDGLNDISLLTMVGKRGSEAYCCWIFDPVKQQFNRDSLLEEISAPFFDAKTKTIHEGWHEANMDGGNNVYRFIKKKITRVYEWENQTIYDDKDQKRIHLTIKKLVKGELKLVYDKYFTEKQFDALNFKSLPQPD